MANLLKRSTVQLLRFHFSFFLMPVYWFALSQTSGINWQKALLIFIILHILVYPASNGYNSYMDRDAGSIGGIEFPLQPQKQLLWITIFMDLLAIALSLFITEIFAAGIVLYILASRAYSYRGIRIKKYPVAGYLLVMICQGALVFALVMHGSSEAPTNNIPALGMIAAALLIGGFYPLTQIYQHDEDIKDGVVTISYKLGYKGTFIFSMIIFSLAMTTIFLYLKGSGKTENFVVMQLFFLPVFAFFSWWFIKVTQNTAHANFRNTMRMNIIASLFTNAAFIYLLLTTVF